MEINLKEDFLKDLNTLIKIKSVRGDCGAETSSAPLGEGINEAIEAFLSIGQRFGFKTKNLDGYCGCIEMGEGEELLGIIAHTDTVKGGDGWSYNPFECTVANNGVYGRGVIDDKGPALLALYAMKAVADSSTVLKKRVRLIIGGDEETGTSLCMKRYKETEELPSISFSPDADYPAVFAEKGLLRVRIYGNETAMPSDFSFSGGSVINIVPDKAQAVINGAHLSKEGVAAHGSMPEKGENAVLKLAEEISRDFPASTFAKLFSLTTASSLGIDVEDSVSKLTVNPSVLHADSSFCELFYDIRYPVTANGEEIISSVKEKAKEKGLCAEITLHEKPLYVPTSSHLVKTLSEIYTAYTSDFSAPKAIGGGTYAKSFKNCVAFGPTFPGEPETMHSPDEFWSFDSIRANFDIMKEAIIRL